MNSIDKNTEKGFLKMSDEYKEVVSELFEQVEVVEEGKFRFKEDENDD